MGAFENLMEELNSRAQTTRDSARDERSKEVTTLATVICSALLLAEATVLAPAFRPLPDLPF